MKTENQTSNGDLRDYPSIKFGWKRPIDNVIKPSWRKSVFEITSSAETANWGLFEINQKYCFLAFFSCLGLKPKQFWIEVNFKFWENLDFP